MRICVAQSKPIKGNFQGNIDRHQKLISLAISEKSDIVIFPELSLTGYEPELAETLATTKEDPRLVVFQQLANVHGISIGVGVPLREDHGITISMVLFRSNRPVIVYSKAHLHEDEQPFFVGGKNTENIFSNIALAICYEISVSEHAATASKNGAKVYIASVAKFANGIEPAANMMSTIARNYSMTVLMSNCIGFSDGNKCGGMTSIWNSQGMLLSQLDDATEGVLVIDTEDTSFVIKKYQTN